MSESADGGHVVRDTFTFKRHISDHTFSNLDDDPLLPISSVKEVCTFTRRKMNRFSFLRAEVCSIVHHPHDPEGIRTG